MAPTGWKTKAIFISSTFRDMQSERDIIRDKVVLRIKVYGKTIKLRR